MTPSDAIDSLPAPIAWPLRLFALLLWSAGWAVAIVAGVGVLLAAFLIGVAVGV